ncbi:MULTISPECIES: isoprenylcysteine carboxylmethyltransferase family protein [unclassified Mycobacterium]|uniref:methyltransferase family protein n=1 Tax=unclassified Mycobacterium TaxID=2642494 RepID=UPI0029C7DBB8|nr:MULTISPECIES: isoprenylcysteine carboxylmethyltransferase family protein [unclassified Mycobacterium]
MKLAIQTIASTLAGLLFFGLALFVPAGTFHYWQAWVFIAVFMLATIVPSFYLAVTNPAALQRRLNAGPTAETRPVQRIIISATVLMVVVLLVVSALDHRFGWSSVPLPVVWIGNVLVAVGLVLAQLVVIQNSYASANITVEADQPLVSTGLYGLVRHPMYVGALIMMFGTPLALDSLWGMIPMALGVPVLAARIVDEEKLLTEQLGGYREYTTHVRSRLIPYVW